MTRRHAAILALTFAALAGCARRAKSDASAALDASADPATGHLAPVGAPLPSAAALAHKTATLDEEASEPTADEASQTPMPRFTPVVPSPTPRSKLPCPAGTTPFVLESALGCRLLHPKTIFHADQGPALSFHKNGKLASQGQYDAGQQTGHWWFFLESGALDYEVDFVDGEWDGVYVSYWPSGARREEHREKAGKHEGAAKQWDERGKLLSWTLFEGDRAVRTKYFR